MEHLPLEELGAVLAAAGTLVVLLADRRALLVGGLVLLALAEVALGRALADDVGLGALGRPAPIVAVAAAVAIAAALAALLARHAAVVPPLVLAAAPFRLPLDIDPDHRFWIARAEAGELGRLLPLYVVLAIAALALVIRLWRNPAVTVVPRHYALPIAAFLAFASLSLLWSHDTDAATSRLAFFIVPFVVLFAVVANAPVAPRLSRTLAILSIGLAVAFASVGIWQAATHRLLFFAPSVEIANEYGPVFRVTSLFTDPSLYGRHVVLGFAVLLVALWLRRIHVLFAAALAAVLWMGLYFSYSQSSLVALFAVALAIPAVAGTRVTRRVVAVAAAALVVAAGAAAANDVRDASLRRATSDRSRRAEVAVRVFAEHPFVGVGLAAQPRASQALDARPAPPPSYVSHTAPLTIAAELGVVGLALYCAILIAVVRVVDRIRRASPEFGLSLAAALVALFVHALFYSGFFEDPITWVALGLAGALARERAVAAERAPALGRADLAPGTP